MRPNTLDHHPEIDKRDLPPIGEAVIVRCPNFQCMAYRGRSNQWWDATDGEELTNVLEIVYRFCR